MWELLDQLTHWHWIILGLMLLITEAFGAAGFTLGAAIGSLVTGCIVWMIGHMAWESQVILGTLLATIFSVLYWKFFQASLQVSDRPELNHRTAQFIGRKLTLEIDIDFEGRIQIGDTFWKVKSAEALKSGDAIEVISVDESTLTIQKI
jgi:membrane protein implicated in regulation of membrane protease activity